MNTSTHIIHVIIIKIRQIDFSMLVDSYDVSIVLYEMHDVFDFKKSMSALCLFCQAIKTNGIENKTLNKIFRIFHIM